MTLKMKVNGGWQTCSPGQARIRWGGAWQTAQWVKIRWNGQWQDSGYRGYPQVPQRLWVVDWDNTNFSWVDIGFWGVAGGPPVSSYHVRQINGNDGRPIRDFYTTSGGPHRFSAAQDERYMFYVSAVGDTGLQGPETPYVGVQMGHTEVAYDDVRNGARAWESPHSGNIAKGKDDPIWWIVGTNVAINQAHFRNLYRGEGTSASVPGFGFTTNWIINNADPGPINGTPMDVPFGLSTDVAIGPATGNNQYWGIVPRGSWATNGDLRYMMVVDDFWFSGTEYYQYTVRVVTRNYQSNGSFAG